MSSKLEGIQWPQATFGPLAVGPWEDRTCSILSKALLTSALPFFISSSAMSSVSMAFLGFLEMPEGCEQALEEVLWEDVASAVAS